MSSTLRYLPGALPGAALLALLACSCTERGNAMESAGAASAVVSEREPNGEAARAAGLVAGETARGRVGARDADWWRLDLAEGAVVSLQVFASRFDQPGWSANAPLLRVLDPDGVTLELEQDAASARAAGWSLVDPDVPAFRAPAAGSYFLVLAADVPARAGGEYLLAVQAVSPALELEREPPLAGGLNDLAATAEPLAPGVLHGQHVAGDVDWYRIQLAEPSLLSFALLAQRNGLWNGAAADFDPELELYAEDGRELAHNDDGIFEDSLLTWLCETPGSYLVRVGECCRAGAAPYFLVYGARELTPLSVRSEVEPNESLSAAPYVEFARLVEGTLEPGDVDSFAIPGRAGDRIEIALLARGAGDVRAIELALLDGHGDEVPTDLGARLDLRETLLDADGTYFLRLASRSELATAYAFELRLVTDRWEQEPDDTPAQASALDADGRAAGRIDAAGDVDLFAVEAQAGVPVLLECFADDEFASGGYDEMDGLGSDMDPALLVLDPDGRLVAAASALERTAVGRVRGRSTVSLVFLPRRSGTHFLAVRDARGASGPTYGYAIERH